MEIQGHPNYLIYKDGRVWSKERLDKSGKQRKGKFLKTRLSNGYYQSKIDNKTLRLHRLIAIHYIDNPDNYKYVDHINRKSTDNRLENLRWVTSSMNSQNRSYFIDNNSGHKYILRHGDGWQFRKVINKKKFNKFNKDLSVVLVYKFFILMKNKRERIVCP